MGTLENVFRLLLEPLALGAEFVGAATITVSVGYAIMPYLRMLGPNAAMPTLRLVRSRLGRGLVLGLEFLIGAAILRLLLGATVQGLTMLGTIVLLRTVLALSIDFELRASDSRESTPVRAMPERTTASAMWGRDGRAV